MSSCLRKLLRFFGNETTYLWHIFKGLCVQLELMGLGGKPHMIFLIFCLKLKLVVRLVFNIWNGKVKVITRAKVKTCNKKIKNLNFTSKSGISIFSMLLTRYLWPSGSKPLSHPFLLTSVLQKNCMCIMLNLSQSFEICSWYTFNHKYPWAFQDLANVNLSCCDTHLNIRRRMYQQYSLLIHG